MRYVYLLASLAVACVALVATPTAQCVRCGRFLYPPPGICAHGDCPPSLMTVYISIPSNLREDLRNAIFAARNQWNSQTARNGSYIPVQIEVGIDTPSQYRTTSIVEESVSNPLGFSEWKDPSNAEQSRIAIDPKNFASGSQVTYQDLVGRVAHEIGHVLGLNDNLNCNPTLSNPSGTPSIIGVATSEGRRDVGTLTVKGQTVLTGANTVQPVDVEAVIKAYNDHEHCDGMPGDATVPEPVAESDISGGDTGYEEPVPQGPDYHSCFWVYWVVPNYYYDYEMGWRWWYDSWEFLYATEGCPPINQ